MQNGMANVSIDYINIEGMLSHLVLHDLMKLYSDIFEDADLLFFKNRIEEHSELYSVLAYHDEKLVGFKIGYPYNETIFYSWIGGILPDFRLHGIAKQMAVLQEQWAKQNGFTSLRTKSMNRFKEMMILNLKNGFEITNIYTNSKGQTKIVFEKHLA